MCMYHSILNIENRPLNFGDAIKICMLSAGLIIVEEMIKNDIQKGQ